MLIASFAFTLNAQDAINLSDPLQITENVVHGKLDNGLTYYVMHNPEPQNRAFLRLVVNVGSAFEDDDQQGLAHMCEHMAFNGTKNFPKHDLISYLGSLGMRFGADLNAYTGFDETAYMLEIPLDSAGFLDKGLLVLADWASEVSYETEEIDNERGIIHEEWRLGNGANDRLRKQTFPVLFYNSLYANRLPIGDTAVFDHCSPDKLRRFYNDWYRPDLQAVIAVGDFDASEVADKIIELFSKIPKRDNPRAHVYPEVPAHQNTMVKVATDKEAPYTLISFYIKHELEISNTYADYRNEYIKNLVASMLRMRLQEIINSPDAPFSYAVAYYSQFVGKTSSFSLLALPKTNQVADAAKVMEQELQRVVKYGFTASELEIAKSSTIADTKNMYDSRAKIGSDTWVDAIHQNYSITKSALLSPEEEYEFVQQIMPGITIDEVNAAAKMLITDENKVVTVTAPEIPLPSEQELLEVIEAAKNADLDAYQEVTLDKEFFTRDIKAGKIKKQVVDDKVGTTTLILKNGIKVVLKPTDFKDNEILFSAFSFGGYSLYPLNDNFNARFCADVAMSSGVGNYNSTELDKFMADKNFSVRPYVGRSTEGFSGNSTVDDFEIMLQMINLYFTEPRFDDDAFQVFISQQKTFIENQDNDPTSAWSDSISATLTNNSPFTKPLTVSNLNKITNAGSAKIYKERFADPSSFTFVFVGSIDIDKVKPLIAKYLGSLPTVKKNETYKDLNADYPLDTKNVTAYKGKDEKSLVYTIIPGQTKLTLADEIGLRALSYILSDSLIDQVRETKRWTYSISASSQTSSIPVEQYGMFFFYSCAPERVDSINTIIVEMADRLSKYPISDEEFHNTIEKLKRKNETDLRTNKFWLDQLRDAYMADGNMDFATEYDNIVNSLTKKSIQDYATKFFKGNYISIALKPEK